MTQHRRSDTGPMAYDQLPLQGSNLDSSHPENDHAGTGDRASGVLRAATASSAPQARRSTTLAPRQRAHSEGTSHGFSHCQLAPSALPDFLPVRVLDAREVALAEQAHDAVGYAVRCGILVRPEHCTRCPRSGPTHAHHFMGYEPEHWFVVLWLCRARHRFSQRRSTIATRIRQRNSRAGNMTAIFAAALAEWPEYQASPSRPAPRPRAEGGR